MVVGLAKYLWKRCADIFLCVIYSKVIGVCDDIHKAVYIIISALVRVFCLCRYFAQAVYNAIFESLVVSKRQIKKVNLSAFGRYICKINVYWSGNLLRPPTYPADLILFCNTFWYQHLFWAGIWDVFLLRPRIASTWTTILFFNLVLMLPFAIICICFLKNSARIL